MFNPNIDSRDGISRVSCGRAFIERRAPTLWDRLKTGSLILVIALLSIAGLTQCEPATATVDYPGGPACVNYGTGVYSCEGY